MMAMRAIFAVIIRDIMIAKPRVERDRGSFTASALTFRKRARISDRKDPVQRVLREAAAQNDKASRSHKQD